MTKITETPEVAYLSGSDRLPVAGDVSGAWSHIRPAGYDVWIIAGQSNATSYAENEEIDARLDWTHSRIWQWPTPHADVGTAYRNKLIPAVDPLLFPPNFLSGEIKVSPGTAFARQILPFIPANRDVILIPGAVPGVGLLQGAWQYPNGDLFVAAKAAAIACTNTLRAEGKDARLRGIIWVQGENEAANLAKDPTEYEEQSVITLNALRDEVPYSDGAVIIVGQMNPDWIDNNSSSPTHQTYAIDAIHRMLPDLMDRCWFVHGPRDSIATGDVIHYGIAGQRTNGKRMSRKARSVALQTNGLGFTAPSVRVVGPTLYITVPDSDAPLFCIQHRPAGSTDEFAEILFSPTEYFEPGDEVAYTISGLTEDVEVRVAGRMAGQNGPFSTSATLAWESVPTALTRPDLSSASVTGNLVTSVPSIGTDTRAWTAPSGKEPVLVRQLNIPVIQTEVSNSLLSCQTSIPAGSYTKMILVKQRSFNGVGTYITALGGLNDSLLQRSGNGLKTPALIFGGGAAFIEASSNMPDSDWCIIVERYDQSASSNQGMLRIITLKNILSWYATVNSRNPQTGLVVNAQSLAGTNGNQAFYADWSVWSSALTDAQILQEAMLMFKRIRLQD